MKFKIELLALKTTQGTYFILFFSFSIMATLKARLQALSAQSKEHDVEPVEETKQEPRPGTTPPNPPRTDSFSKGDFERLADFEANIAASRKADPHVRAAYLRQKFGIPSYIRIEFFDKCPAGFVKSKRPSPGCHEAMQNIMYVDADDNFCEDPSVCVALNAPDEPDSLSRSEKEQMYEAQSRRLVAEIEALTTRMRRKHCLENMLITMARNYPQEYATLNVKGKKLAFSVPRSLIHAPEPTEDTVTARIDDAMYRVAAIHSIVPQDIRVRLHGNYLPLRLARTLNPQYRTLMQPIIEYLNTVRKTFIESGYAAPAFKDAKDYFPWEPRHIERVGQYNTQLPIATLDIPTGILNEVGKPEKASDSWYWKLLEKIPGARFLKRHSTEKSGTHPRNFTKVPYQGGKQNEDVNFAQPSWLREIKLGKDMLPFDLYTSLAALYISMEVKYVPITSNGAKNMENGNYKKEIPFGVILEPRDEYGSLPKILQIPYSEFEKEETMSLALLKKSIQFKKEDYVTENEDGIEYINVARVMTLMERDEAWKNDPYRKFMKYLATSSQRSEKVNFRFIIWRHVKKADLDKATSQQAIMRVQLVSRFFPFVLTLQEVMRYRHASIFYKGFKVHLHLKNRGDTNVNIAPRHASLSPELRDQLEINYHYPRISGLDLRSKFLQPYSDGKVRWRSRNGQLLQWFLENAAPEPNDVMNIEFTSPESHLLQFYCSKHLYNRLTCHEPLTLFDVDNAMLSVADPDQDPTSIFNYIMFDGSFSSPGAEDSTDNVFYMVMGPEGFAPGKKPYAGSVTYERFSDVSTMKGEITRPWAMPVARPLPANLRKVHSSMLSPWVPHMQQMESQMKLREQRHERLNLIRTLENAINLDSDFQPLEMSMTVQEFATEIVDSLLASAKRTQGIKEPAKRQRACEYEDKEGRIPSRCVYVEQDRYAMCLPQPLYDYGITRNHFASRNKPVTAWFQKAAKFLLHSAFAENKDHVLADLLQSVETQQ